VALVTAVLWAGTLAAQDRALALDALLTSYHSAGVFNGAALVSENGKVVFKKGFGLADFEWNVPNTSDTKFRIGSITKQFTATLVMQLVEEGKLSLDATLTSVLPYYRRDTGSRVTVHHLLTHGSGIPSYTDLPNFFRDVSRNPYGVREFIETYCSGDLEFEPGAKFHYTNSGYFLLGAIIEQVTGKPYEQVLRERIFDPLGMKGSGYDLSRPILEKRARGYEQGPSGMRNADYLDMHLPYAAGALYSTVEDLYLWDQALHGEKVLPVKAKERMFTTVLGNYGYGWTIQQRPVGPSKGERLIVGHVGGINGFNTLITRVLADRHLVVLFNNTGSTNLAAMADGIIDILYGRTPPPAPAPVVKVQRQAEAPGNSADTKVDVTAPAASLIGKWTLTAETAVGPRPFWLDLKIDPKDPKKLTGTITTLATKDVVEGEVVAGAVTFWFSSVGPDGGAVRVTFAGTAQKDGALAGTLSLGQSALMPWRAVRGKK
jgi:CubicO group peptidase (beta-lactamase class C family)